MKRANKGLSIFLACVLTFSIFSSFGVASAQMDASAYLSSYGAYISPVGNGDMRIWFEVNGTGTMDDIGVTQIILESSMDGKTWTRARTYTYDLTKSDAENDYPQMMAHNTYFNDNYVTHNGTANRYYRAYVNFYAGKDGGSSTRASYTPVVLTY